MTGLPFPSVRADSRAPAGTVGLPDQLGRVARDLRVSVTDRCNLRCRYCMPAEGLPWLAKPEMLTDDELVRVIGVFVGLGVQQIRLTGGEPLLRRSLVDVVRRVAALEPRPRIAMTTNGIGLDRLAQPLADAGLDRVNVSLDTIDPQEFADLTRRDRLHDVELGLKAAAAAGLTPVKVNAVAMRGINDHSVADLLAVVPRPRLRAAVHRADAARRPARLGRLDDDQRRGDPRAARGAVHADAAAGRRPGERAGRAVPRRRWTRDRRHHRERHVRRSARPATAPGSPRTARCATACSRRRRPTCSARCATAPATRSSPRLIQGEMWRKAPGHGIGDGRLRPARPADVGHRRLTNQPNGSVRRLGPTAQSDCSVRLLSRRSRGSRPRPPSRSGSRGSTGTRRATSVVVAGQPDLATIGGVQLRVVPEVRPGRGVAARLGAADEGLHQRPIWSGPSPRGVTGAEEPGSRGRTALASTTAT